MSITLNLISFSFICDWITPSSSCNEGLDFLFWYSGCCLFICGSNSVLLITKSFNLLANSERFSWCVSFSSYLWNWRFSFSHCQIHELKELSLALEFESSFLEFMHSSKQLLHVSMLNISLLSILDQTLCFHFQLIFSFCHKKLQFPLVFHLVYPSSIRFLCGFPVQRSKYWFGLSFL